MVALLRGLCNGAGVCNARRVLRRVPRAENGRLVERRNGFAKTFLSPFFLCFLSSGWFYQKRVVALRGFSAFMAKVPE